MNRLQKTIGGILIAGLLTTGMGNAALAADTVTATADASQQQHKMGMGRGGNFFSVDQLQEKISGLSTEQQTEILALAEQLNSYQPEKPTEAPDMTEQEDLFAQIKAVFTEAGITLPEMTEQKERPTDMTADDADGQRPERPERPADMADTDGERPEPPEKPADATNATTDDSQRPAKGNRADGTHPFVTTIQEYLTQLDEADQATVTALLEQLAAKQDTRMAEKQDAVAIDDETMTTVKALQDQLTQLLSDNGITMDRPVKK